MSDLNGADEDYIHALGHAGGMEGVEDLVVYNLELVRFNNLEIEE